jgi:hypothetical protein
MAPFKVLVPAILVMSIFSCKKDAQSNTHPPPVVTDTTFDFEPGEALTGNEFEIFQQFEDTSGLTIRDLILPDGDSLINYVSPAVSKQYPLSVNLPVNSPAYPANTVFPVYQPKWDQLNKFYNLLADITWKAQYLTQKMRGNPLYPDEGKNKPAQNKIGYASGTMYAIVNGLKTRLWSAGKDYTLRKAMYPCTDSIHALDNSGFMKYIFNGINHFPDNVNGQNNTDSITLSLADVLDMKRFELIDIPGDFNKTDSLLAGDIISFSYNFNPVHTGFIGRGHQAIAFYHSIGQAPDCDGNKGPGQGPVTWTIKDKWKAFNFTKMGTVTYSTKRIRYIAELEKISSPFDSTAGVQNTVQVRVFSSDNLPVNDGFPVNFSTQNGIVSSGTLTKNGMASADWTTSASGGVQTCTATILSPVDHTTILDQVTFSVNTIQKTPGTYTLSAISPIDIGTFMVGNRLGPLMVKLVDDQNNPVSGAYLQCTNGTGGGFSSPHGNVITDGTGLGGFYWTLGNVPGLQTITIDAYIPPPASPQIINSVTFYAMVFLPDLMTIDISEITQTTAVSGGYTNYSGVVFAIGVCWSTSHNPTADPPTIYQTNDKQTFNGTSFTSQITGLAPNQTYYVRSYLTFTTGTIYGQEQSFTTSN